MTAPNPRSVQPDPGREHECPECFHVVEHHDENGCDMQTGSWETGPVDCPCPKGRAQA